LSESFNELILDSTYLYHLRKRKESKEGKINEFFNSKWLSLFCLEFLMTIFCSLRRVLEKRIICSGHTKIWYARRFGFSKQTHMILEEHIILARKLCWKSVKESQHRT